MSRKKKEENHEKPENEKTTNQDGGTDRGTDLGESNPVSRQSEQGFSINTSDVAPILPTPTEPRIRRRRTKEQIALENKATEQAKQDERYEQASRIMDGLIVLSDGILEAASLSPRFDKPEKDLLKVFWTPVAAQNLEKLSNIDWKLAAVATALLVLPRVISALKNRQRHIEKRVPCEPEPMNENSQPQNQNDGVESPLYAPQPFVSNSRLLDQQ